MKEILSIFLVVIGVANAYANEWQVFTPPARTYKIEFPTTPQPIKGSDIYASKDGAGNLFAVQEFVPPEDETRKQSSKDILQTITKVLVAKSNVKISRVEYTKYRDEYVAVDFVGNVNENNKIFMGKVILEGKTTYCMYAVLLNQKKASIDAYNRFIGSFRLSD